MSRIGFTAFYPSRPFWAGSKVDFTVPRVDGWFYDQMVEEVLAYDQPEFSVRVCRDGRIMVRVPRLEPQGDNQQHSPIEETVQRWGEYLDYMNTFYLLLDSATIEVDHSGYFNLHEITNRDAFRVTYEDGKSVVENIAIESIASIFQRGRLSGNYSSYDAIEHDTMIWLRRVVSLQAIEAAVSKFAVVASTPSLVRTVASFAKSLAEYKVGNYETSVVLAWFIAEAAVGELWRS